MDMKIEREILVPFTRVLDNSCRKLKYRKSKNNIKKPLHWGQRKLLITEIEFLTLYNRARDILYIGAADGKHILYLSILFPNNIFILYDPNKFDENLFNIKNIIIKNQKFTEIDALKYSNQEALLISDIRNIPKKNNKNNDVFGDEIEYSVYQDMEMQKKWYNIIKPNAALLKFRLPYGSGKTEYLRGELRFQPWAPLTSTETRLIVLPEYNYKTKIYDNEQYESILYRFNQCTRIQNFNEFFSKYNIDVGIFKSYDLAAEINIISNYLGEKNTDENITQIINDINKYLGKNFRIKYLEKHNIMKVHIH